MRCVLKLAHLFSLPTLIHSHCRCSAKLKQSNLGEHCYLASHCVTTEVSGVYSIGENAQDLSLHNNPAEIKNPYCANSIRRKCEEKKEKGEKGGTRDGGRRRQEGGGQLAALPSMPAVCEKAAVAY